MLALVAGVTVWVFGRDHGDRRPFDAAVANLAHAPGVHYRTSMIGGTLLADVRVTAHGDASGSVTVAGQRFGLLVLDGRTYLRTPDGLFPEGRVAQAAALKGRWITGDQALFGPVLGQLGSPSTLAHTLHRALERTSRFPDRGEVSGTVNGEMALKAATPSGDLYVTATPPYRVLRFSPGGAGAVPRLPSLPAIPSLPSGLPGAPGGAGGAGGPSVPGLPSLPALPSLPGLPSVPDLPGDPGDPQDFDPGGPAAPLPGGLPQDAAGVLGDMDLSPMSPAETDQTYGDLEAGARQLTTAVDSSVQFQVQGEATVSAGPAGAEVAVTVTNEVTDPKAKQITGQVTAELTATVMANGRPAGSCTSTAVLPINASGEISCTDVAFAETYAVLQAEAAELAQEGEPPPPIEVTAQAQVFARATGQEQVERQVNRLVDQQQDVARQVGLPKGRPPVTATRSAPAPGGRTPFAGFTDLLPSTRYEVNGRGEFYTDEAGRVVRVETMSGSRGKLNPELNRPQPNTVYVVDGRYAYRTDARGRTVEMHTSRLDLDPRTNTDDRRSPEVQLRIGRQGNSTAPNAKYEGGHLAGTKFRGPPEAINLVPMLERVNRGAGRSFAALEAKWRRILAKDPDAVIDVEIRLVYKDDSTVPVDIIVEYTINGGKPVKETFHNVP